MHKIEKNVSFVKISSYILYNIQVIINQALLNVVKPEFEQLNAVTQDMLCIQNEVTKFVSLCRRTVLLSPLKLSRPWNTPVHPLVILSYNPMPLRTSA